MKVVPIESMSGSSEIKHSLTWMSWLARMIIVISPVSVNEGWTDVKFKFFSRATFLHLLVFLGPMLIFVLASTFNGDHSQILTKSIVDTFKTYNLVDSLSLLFMLLILPTACVIPFFTSIGIPCISSLALAGDLRWPKYGILGPVGALLFFFSSILCEYISATSTFLKKKDPKQHLCSNLWDTWTLDAWWFLDPDRDSSVCDLLCHFGLVDLFHWPFCCLSHLVGGQVDPQSHRGTKIPSMCCCSALPHLIQLLATRHVYNLLCLLHLLTDRFYIWPE